MPDPRSRRAKRPGEAGSGLTARWTDERVIGPSPFVAHAFDVPLPPQPARAPDTDLADAAFTVPGGNDKDLIYVEDGFSRPAIREISSVSAAVRGLQEGYRIHRICFPAELKGKIGELYHGSV